MACVSERDNMNSSARNPERPLERMFDVVSERYDLLNRLLTLRMDERWRRRASARWHIRYR